MTPLFRDLSRALPAPINPVVLEQWETLCSVATPAGLCTNRAVDCQDVVRICVYHTSIVIGQAVRRLETQLDTAIAEDEHRAQQAEESLHAREEEPGHPG